MDWHIEVEVEGEVRAPIDKDEIHLAFSFNRRASNQYSVGTLT
jgi:hypothetical protein